MFTLLWSILSLQSKYSVLKEQEFNHANYFLVTGPTGHSWSGLVVIMGLISLISFLPLLCFPDTLSFHRPLAYTTLLPFPNPLHKLFYCYLEHPSHCLPFPFTNIHILSGVTWNPTIISFLRFAMRSSFLLAPLIEHALLCGSMLNWNQYFIHSLMSALPYSESSMKAETTSVLLTTMF